MGVCQNTKNNRQKSQIKASPIKNNNFSKDNTAETGNEKQIESEEKLKSKNVNSSEKKNNNNNNNNEDYSSFCHKMKELYRDSENAPELNDRNKCICNNKLFDASDKLKEHLKKYDNKTS